VSPAPPQHALRTEPRVPAKVQLGVSTDTWDGFVMLWTKDVSPGGAFLHYTQRVAPVMGARCKVRIGTAETDGIIAHVITTRLAAAIGGDAGFGVAFALRQPVDWWTPLLPGQAAAVEPAPQETRRTPPTAKELESAANFHSLGMSFYDQRDFAAARQKFELAGRISGDRRHAAMAAVCVGQIFARSGQPAKARESFDRALQLDSNCAPATAAQSEVSRRR
jgi:hypothetical protein